jgi:hypothetical protein
VIHLFKRARKVDEADNFAFVQLTEQERAMYDKRHAEYAKRDKIDLAFSIYLSLPLIHNGTIMLTSGCGISQNKQQLDHILITYYNT